jgi:DNA mismatch endonuclease (patch repair protein)
VAEAWRQPFASSEAVRERMKRLARRDTNPELALRRGLHRQGLRYFVHRRPVPNVRRQADIVFPRAKVAVFVDGCFWHGCPQHGRRKHKTNDWYWSEKIRSNQARDRDTNAQLAAAGWHVIRIWEHESVSLSVGVVCQAVQTRQWVRVVTETLKERQHGLSCN